MSTGVEAGAAVDAHMPSWLAQICRTAMFKKLDGLSAGAIELREGQRCSKFGAASPTCPLSVVVEIHDPGCYVDLALGGTVGAAESFMRGQWRTNDLTGLVQVFVRNRHLMQNMNGGIANLVGSARNAYHWFRRNTLRGSQANIAAHYDLGNDFFKLFLDETLMYSAAVYPSEEASLLEASVHKLDLICRKLDLKPTDKVLEIGTGWGGFALHAARHYGCHVTTTTISKKQFEMAKGRIQEAGLASQITVLDHDYRHLRGQFDKLVSIEMIEAIGHQFFDVYFSQLNRLLKPDGAALIQAIVMPDHHYERAKKSADFIKRYIFPGGCLPSVAAIMSSVATRTDLLLVDLHDIGLDYARTLREWHDRFMANANGVRDLGFSEEFLRMWQYYLCYCEGAFKERAISDVQLLFHKPLNPAAAGLRGY